METLMTGIVFGESPRWYDGRLWLSDWGAGQVIALQEDGSHEVVVEMQSFPMCIDFLPDGRLLAMSSADQRLMRRDSDGSLTTHADLSLIAQTPWNEVNADGRGNVFVNNIAFDFPDGDVKPGFVAVVAPDGTARRAAEDLAFPNGMAITPDGSTLIVTESYAGRLTAFEIAEDGGLSNRRVWAELGDAAPDGITLDAEGAIWYADVPHQCCVRVREGGEVLAKVELDRGCFSCALGGDDGRTLFMVGQSWGGPEDGGPSGVVVATRVDVPASPRPATTRG